jgi:hypothetical protein
MGLLCRDFTKLQKINDWVPMLEDWVPMQKDWVPMQFRTKLRMEQASPVKNNLEGVKLQFCNTGRSPAVPPEGSAGTAVDSCQDSVWLL